MPKVHYKDREFDSEHEAICSALFDKYGWKWERPERSFGGWRPDFLLRGDTDVLVECKGNLEWDGLKDFVRELQRYEDAVKQTQYEVLLIPKSPKMLKNSNQYDVAALGYLYDGELWSVAELGKWSGRVGFCHSANSWKDRISGHNVNLSSGDGPRPNAEMDWHSATQIYKGKRVSYFKEFYDSEPKEWTTSG